jgi:hypothetical protein
MLFHVDKCCDFHGCNLSSFSGAHNTGYAGYSSPIGVKNNSGASITAYHIDSVGRD